MLGQWTPNDADKKRRKRETRLAKANRENRQLSSNPWPKNYIGHPAGCRHNNRTKPVGSPNGEGGGNMH